jgi:hypothetical protein
MKTLYEEARKIFPEINGAEVIHIQNVADYLFSLEKEYESVVSNIPNIAPPFPCFWMEFTLADTLYDGRQMRENDIAPGARFGFIFESVKDSEQGEAFWKTKIRMFSSISGYIQKSFLFKIEIDKEGQGLSYSIGLPPDTEVPLAERLSMEAEADNWAWSMLHPALLAVAFLHCKNVNLITNEPRKVSSRRASQRASKIRFHTLQIEPMKKILHDEGRIHETGIKHALHICRGHFKDFSKGKGLFGKYQGMYWWDSQVRGRGEVGAVVKDYNVNNPQS